MKLSSIIIGVCFILLVVLIALEFTMPETYGEKRSGTLTGVLNDFDIDDDCGDVLWCYTKIWLDNQPYYFGRPCNAVKTLELNNTYTFDYIPYRNMGCSGDYFWDIQISNIYDIDGNILWSL